MAKNSTYVWCRGSIHERASFFEKTFLKYYMYKAFIHINEKILEIFSFFCIFFIDIWSGNIYNVCVAVFGER